MRASLPFARLNACLLAIGMAVSAFAQNGPTQPPANPNDWPGKGTAGVYDSWTQRRQLFWDSRAKDRGAVVFLGDSITHGWYGLEKAFPELKVANRGIGSDTSRRLVFRLKEDVLDLNPRAIVLLIGINDLSQGVSPADIAHNINLILGHIRRHRADTPVVLCHVMPWKKEPGQYPERIQSLNRLMDGLAIGQPTVAICETWPGLATPEGKARPEAFRDAVHPNAAGYEIWAANLRPALARLKITD